MFTNHDRLDELINDEGVYRTVPATLGLLIIQEVFKTIYDNLRGTGDNFVRIWRQFQKNFKQLVKTREISRGTQDNSRGI